MQCYSTFVPRKIPENGKIPDKEFCYLKIVIVMVAVPRGFSCRLPYYEVTNFFDFLALGRVIHDLTALQSPVFLVNNRLGLVTATPSSISRLLLYPVGKLMDARKFVR